MERTWGPKNVIKADEFQGRATASRALLGKLAFPVKIETKGPTPMTWPVLGRNRFHDSAEVRLSADSPIAGELCYTTDGTEPTSKSSVYSEPIQIKDSTAIQAALFRNGQQVGHVSRKFFERTTAQ
jgi:N-acetyl-beta-hexosaminidase